jgi:glycine/D-amino acid oxidase-like deaminating enzyme
VKADVDYLVIGGGFYGAALSLFLRSVSDSIMLVEAGSALMQRASRVNQARIHTGFHYPRSALTAVKSMMLHRRFADDFPEAVMNDFQMLYGIARYRSKVSSKRFLRMYRDMGAPIATASAAHAAIFDNDRVEAAFACTEFAFDYSVLQHHLTARLDALNVDLRLQTEVVSIEEKDQLAVVALSSGQEITARYVFNVTYAQLNSVLRRACLPLAKLKYELSEIALVTPPVELKGLAVTMMDGPFFSVMPFPSTELYSLTHVRYTPHYSWTDDNESRSSYEVFKSTVPDSHVRHMIADGQRYLPCLRDATWQQSLYEVKAMLLKNEHDDGRPILYQRHPATSRVISILGGKIDNIYDLFDLVRSSALEWSLADSRYVRPGDVSCNAS